MLMRLILYYPPKPVRIFSASTLNPAEKSLTPRTGSSDGRRSQWDRGPSRGSRRVALNRGDLSRVSVQRTPTTVEGLVCSVCGFCFAGKDETAGVLREDARFWGKSFVCFL